MTIEITSRPITDNDEGMKEQEFGSEQEALAALESVPSLAGANADAFVASVPGTVSSFEGE